MATNSNQGQNGSVHQGSARVEGTSSVTANAIVLASLPGLTPEEAKNFYERALNSLPATRIRGYYGVTDGSEERADDVVLLLHDKDKMNPTLKLVMSKADLRIFSAALHELIEQRFKEG